MVIPNLSQMHEEDIRNWVYSLTKEQILADLVHLSDALTQRFGQEISFILSSKQPPKFYMLEVASTP
ncbi:hypothetical protein MASR2M15_15400 [Anaerolineales bacterium]